MTWISSSSAPPLDELFVPVLANYLLNVTLGARGGSHDPAIRSYIHAFIVNCDKAIRSYSRGRKALLDYAGSQNTTTLIVEAVGEFETSILATKRCLTVADRMATHQHNPEIDRTKRRQLDSHQKTIRPIRDLVEHIDGDIAAGVVGPGDPQMLFVSQEGDALVIGARRLLFVDLALALRAIHGLAEALAARDPAL